MIAAIVASLLIPVAIGTLLVRASGVSGRAGWLVDGSLGAVAGASLLSLLYFLERLVLPGSAGLQWSVELAVLGGAIVVYRRAERPAEVARQPASAMAWVLGAALLVLLAAAVGAFWRASEAAPYGEWDAWAIWNLRAKFLADPGEAWRLAYSPLLAQLPGETGTHHDYPLLLSSFIARVWLMSGTAGDPVAPIAAAGLFSLACVGLVTGGIAVLRGWTLGLAAGLIVLSNVTFVAQPPTQYSDIPFACYVLAAFVAFQLRGRYAMPMAGFAAGSAAWCKDEGVLFAALVLGGLALGALFRRIEGGLLLRFFVGSAIPLGATLLLKLVLAGGAGSWQGLTLEDAVGKLGDGTRYTQILSVFWDDAVAMGTGVVHPAVLVAILWIGLGISLQRLREPLVAFSGAVWCGLLAGYVAVYAITPFDLAWHLSTSASRLLTQLAPAGTFLAVLICGAREARLPGREIRGSRGRT